MKKIFKLLLLLPALLATGCNETTTSSSEDEVLYPRSVLESKWGLEAAIASYEALGVAIPYIDCVSFDYKQGVDDYGDKDIWFYCYYETDEDAEKAYNEYLEICRNRGYSGQAGENTYFDYDSLTVYTYPVAIVDRVIGEHQGVELQFLPSVWNSKPCLGIYGMSYLYIDENVYPQLAVDTLFGKETDVPKVEGEGLTYDFQFSIVEDIGQALEIIVYGASYDVEEKYFNDLMKTENYGIYQCSDIDDDYMEDALEYPGYEMGMYYYAYSEDKVVIFEYDIYNSVFVIDMFPIKEILRR